jgi:hypothetical protein
MLKYGGKERGTYEEKSYIVMDGCCPAAHGLRDKRGSGVEASNAADCVGVFGGGSQIGA